MAKTIKTSTKKSDSESYTKALGRRKTASARVRLFKGDSESTVNGRLVGTYFPTKVSTGIWQEPFVVTETLGKFYFSAKVVGGGKNGQLIAVRHAIARALNSLDESYRAALKSAGLLTRDSRERERRMAGTGGKSRRAKQSPKR